MWASVLGVIPGILAGQGVIHHNVSEGWTRSPATDSAMTTRLGLAASEYRQYAPVPRIALYNIGYPSDAAEYNQLNGYGAIVVTVVAQDSAELPLARLYFRDASGVETDLSTIVYTCGKLTASDTAIAATLDSTAATRCICFRSP